MKFIRRHAVCGLSSVVAVSSKHISRRCQIEVAKQHLNVELVTLRPSPVLLQRYCDTSSSESSLQSNSQPTASRIQLKVENPNIVTLHSHIIVLSDALQLFHGFPNPHTLHTQAKLLFTAAQNRECTRESYVNFPATKRVKILIKCRVENYLFRSYVVLVGRESEIRLVKWKIELQVEILIFIRRCCRSLGLTK